MKTEFVRNPYNYDSDKLSEDTGLKCLDESLTEQDHLEETDINYIADKFLRTGMAPQVIHMPTYGDFEGIWDFQSAMNVITDAKREFMRLPAKIRSRFSNDPQELLNFLDDPTNRDEAVKLGFIQEREPADEDDDIPSSLRKDTSETKATPDAPRAKEKPARDKTAPRKSDETDQT